MHSVGLCMLRAARTWGVKLRYNKYSGRGAPERPGAGVPRASRRRVPPEFTRARALSALRVGGRGALASGRELEADQEVYRGNDAGEGGVDPMGSFFAGFRGGPASFRPPPAHFVPPVREEPMDLRRLGFAPYLHHKLAAYGESGSRKKSAKEKEKEWKKEKNRETSTNFRLDDGSSAQPGDLFTRPQEKEQDQEGVMCQE